MDEQVLAAIRRWPNVPDVYGWLRLDRRGRWCLIDRNQPAFDEARDGRGSPISNAQIVAFIGRNYECRDDGCWYWQNGPQRAFVELDVAPFIYRVIDSDGEPRLMTHVGDLCNDVFAAMTGRDGELYVRTEFGIGAVHDLDLAQLELDLPAAHDSAHEDPVATRPAAIWQWHGRDIAVAAFDAAWLDFETSPLRHQTATQPAGPSAGSSPAE